MILHLFSRAGHTRTFREVTDFNANESTFSFCFRALSDGTIKTACFDRCAFEGWTLGMEEE